MKIKELPTDPIDCRSIDGITISLLETIMMCSYLLRDRDKNHQEVEEALKDLRSCKELNRLLGETHAIS